MCEFLTQKFRYLSYTIETVRLSIEEVVVKELREAKQTRIKKELSSFAGLCNVYRRFVSC